MGTRLTPDELLKTNYYCVLSTCSQKGIPWSTPIFYTYDDRWQLFWISALNSHHSSLLSENPRASTVIYQPPGVAQETSALFLTGTVSICKQGEAGRALELYRKRTELGVSGQEDDYLDKSLCRIYCLSPVQAFILQEPEWESNVLVEKRVQIPLPAPDV